MEKIKILFVGDLNEYARSHQRFKALERLGINVHGLSSVPIGEIPGVSQRISFREKVQHKLGRHIDKTGINKSLVKKLQEFQPDVLWIEKVLCLKSQVLEKIRSNFPLLKIVHCCEDDMFAKHNSSVNFRESLTLFDFVFTTKTYNLNAEELPSLGAKRVEIFKNCFDPELNKPVKPRDEFLCDVSFIGTFEEDRAQKCLYLAEHGINIRLWGNGWDSYKNRNPNLHIENKPVYNDDFVSALSSSKINLCFLRKINRDLQTSRSVEIPACGAFMLAERTDEHLQLFEENKEAAFFDQSNPEELLDKVRYYLGNNEERNEIAQKGRERCLKSGYSHDEELKRMLGIVLVG